VELKVTVGVLFSAGTVRRMIISTPPVQRKSQAFRPAGTATL
jgi:hypothetical protein